MNKSFVALSLSVLMGGLLLFGSACRQASAQDIQGLLQAIEGKEMVVKLDDGSTVRITVQDSKAAAEAGKLVGKQIDASVRSANGEQELEKIENRAVGEDQTISGAIQSIDANSAKINGQTFKITANTQLDGGLVPGVTARVEFIKLADGTLLATEIETDKGVQKARGKIDSIAEDRVVIGGQAFHIDSSTRKEAGLAAGQQANIEFTDDKGVKHVTELEKQVEDALVTGAIQAITGNTVTINGRTFKINAATRLDSGLAVGVPVRLEFITMANGDVIATEVENDQAEIEIAAEHGPEIEAGDDKGGGGKSGSGGSGK